MSGKSYVRHGMRFGRRGPWAHHGPKRHGGHDSYFGLDVEALGPRTQVCLLYTSPSPRDRTRSRMPSSA